MRADLSDRIKRNSMTDFMHVNSISDDYIDTINQNFLRVYCRLALKTSLVSRINNKKCKPEDLQKPHYKN